MRVDADDHLIKAADFSLTSACPMNGLVTARSALCPQAGQIAVGGNINFVNRKINTSFLTDMTQAHPEKKKLQFIDAHHHFWDLEKNNYPWLKDHPEPNFFLGNYDRIKRNYLFKDYVQDSQDFEVLATVHCEAEWNRNDQVGETQWLSDIHAQTGLPTAIVAHAWFDTDNAEEVLSKQAAFPLVKGIRSKPKTTLSPDLLTKNRPGGMQDNRWLEGYARLEQYGLSWDLRVPYWHLYEAAEVARQFPNTPIVLNHTGFPWDRSAQGIDAWSKAMEALAKHHHVHLKVSEFGLKDQAWDFASNKEIVLRAIGIFGIERCMFASNFPVAGLRVDFSTLLNSVASMVSEFSEKQQHDFFVGNAARFYRLDI